MTGEVVIPSRFDRWGCPSEGLWLVMNRSS